MKSTVSFYIPTYKRVDKQITIRFMPDEFMPYTKLVCVADEAKPLRKLYPDAGILVQPAEIKTIAQKRAWLFKVCDTDKMFMFDDDLRFCKREPGSFEKLHVCQKNDPDLIKLLHQLISKLDTYAHVGISPRQLNNREPEEWIENTRAIYALGFDVKTVLSHCQLGRIEHREDMDYTLQLLRKGFPNLISYGVCCQQAGYQAKGGASSERTMEASNADALLLAKLHPGLVEVKPTKYKNSINRLEVRVQWRKAYASSKRTGFFGASASPGGKASRS
jgi:hypothetical protein